MPAPSASPCSSLSRHNVTQQLQRAAYAPLSPNRCYKHITNAVLQRHSRRRRRRYAAQLLECHLTGAAAVALWKQ